MGTVHVRETYLDNCPECGKPWPQQLRQPKSSLWCESCRAEKQQRYDFAIQHNLAAHEKRMAEYIAGQEKRWATMTPEERKAESDRNIRDLWGP